MNRRFFTPFLCLILSGCFGGGGGGSDSGASSKKKAKSCTTTIAHGEGEIPWDKKTKKYTTCTVTSCDAGYDNDVDSTKCQETASGFYSLAKDKTRKTCPTTIPSHSLNNTITGLKLETDCWNCNSGFLKNTRGAASCKVPSKGNYVNAQGSESSCNPIGIEGAAIATWIVGAAATAATCPFSCTTGYVKSGRACKIPAKGQYADNGVEKSCFPITGDTYGFDDFAVNTGAVTAANGCGFSCNAGFVKDSSDRACNYPSSGNFVNAGGNEASCDSITSITTEGTAIATWIRGAAVAANTCPFSCTPGYVKNSAGRECKYPSKGSYADTQGAEDSCTDITGITGFDAWVLGAATADDACPFSCTPGYVKSGRACKIPAKGQYANNGVETSCSPITGDTDGFDDFAVNTGAVSTATGCGFSCNAGFVKDSSARECNYPNQGTYVNASGAEVACTDITSMTGFGTWVSGAATTAITCPFSCSAGFAKSGRLCNYPSTGNYVTAGNTESPCNSITTEGTAVATWITGAASTATTCPFSCTAGYSKDISSGECKYPTQGTYVDVQGDEVSCIDLSGMTGFGSWLDGAATDQDSCPFSCASGYTVSGRTCRQPETLALGIDTSHVLFDNGEVEAWGKVSVSPWRSHIKEDLGSNTPQALVSGDYHQCIILENAGQNHGRLMCWGQNNFGELGVGDIIPRTTPIAVTATILGDTGDGMTPKTVKSVAAGGVHTCAILNDDTVVCWGANSSRQIGGGTAGANKTIISGTLGAPLGSTTASRIAAGYGHTCAVLTTDNSVQCWGLNTLGQAGGGVPSLGVGKTATEIAVGDTSSCAILNDSSVVCWGSIGSPNLGGKTATKIATGEEHACALLNDKTVKCWGGGNRLGETGGGTSGSDRVLRGTLGDPLGGQTAIQIVAGYKHTCAIMESDHSVKCWGKNIAYNDTGFYGQIVGGVAMTGGTNGTGTSTGETATLTAVSTPTATSLDSDASGKICALALSGGTLTNPRAVKHYTTPLTYNAGGSTLISDAIDNLIMAIGSPVKVAGTNVTLSKSGTDKIVATTDTAALEGMTLTIYHDDDGGDCTSSPVDTEISLSGASGGDKAEGLWVISNDYTGSGDKTINLDSVHLDLGSAPRTKELIADEIITKVTDGNWAGKQNKDLPYTVTKLDGASSTTDDCPSGDFCVLFSRVFKGTEGNYGIPFGDRDYEH